MSNGSISIGQTVWSMNSPTITGKVIGISDRIAKILTKTDELEINILVLTNDPNKVIEKLVKNIAIHEESIQELRDNYWNVHQQLLKMRQ